MDDAVLLRDHTTFHLGGPARRWAEASSEADLVEAVAAADAAGEPVFVLSGGSNVLVGDDGFDGLVVHVASDGIRTDDVTACGGAVVRVAAGVPWDRFVAWCVEQGYSGVEALSGIPGLVGATPVQNVGAYGAEVAQVIEQVRVWDRATRTRRTFSTSECRFGYRDSLFKQSRQPGQPTGRYVVVEVVFQLKPGTLSAPLRYGELSDALGCVAGGRAPLAEVRQAVLALRRSKGMVYDEADHDSWSAGSFFVNPVLTPEAAAGLPADAPRYPQPDGRVKTSAAWLIAHAGLERGWGLYDVRLSDGRTMPIIGPASQRGDGDGPIRAALSSKHTLALTNRGPATARDVLDLAAGVQRLVRMGFGIDLEPEPVLVGLDGPVGAA